MSEDAPQPRRRREPLWLKLGAPLVIGVLALAAWEALIYFKEIPWYILPGPIKITETLIRDWHMLWPSLLATLRVTALALLVAVVGGFSLAVLFASARWIELSLFPYAVILQVTPIVAIAPLIIIYVDNLTIALLICAWIVAFFPILSNTTIGLNSADHNLLDLMRLYGAKRRQVLWFIRIPGALPFFLGGLRISGGLALIGAIVAEFVAGGAGAGSGLAFRILEASYRLEIPRMYAALFLISATGIVIFLAFTVLTNLLLGRWHESAIRREG
ncbi:MAG: ABC transporter permease [Alphaproteobacteria bacterium]|nr:ABC transporter permease [Alphaproteobacteria bacterium]